jgi:hypothetical protein
MLSLSILDVTNTNIPHTFQPHRRSHLSILTITTSQSLLPRNERKVSHKNTSIFASVAALQRSRDPLPHKIRTNPIHTSALQTVFHPEPSCYPIPAHQRPESKPEAFHASYLADPTHRLSPKSRHLPPTRPQGHATGLGVGARKRRCADAVSKGNAGAGWLEGEWGVVEIVHLSGRPCGVHAMMSRSWISSVVGTP